MKIAVTGATGFVGSHLVPALRARGHTIVPMSRHSESPGDIMDKGYVASCLDGCEMVYHLAAKVGAGYPVKEYAVNIVGTSNLIEVAKDLHIGRLVHLSTLAVLDEYKQHIGTTEQAHLPRRLKDQYAITKERAERIVLLAMNEIAVSVLRPGWIWGSGDKGTEELFKMVKKGTFRFIGDGENLTYFTHIDNLIGVLVRLTDIELFPNGEVFHITDGDERKMKDFVYAIADALKVERPKKRIPKSVATMLASTYEMFSKRPVITKQNVNILANDLFFPIDKARRSLDYNPSTDYIAQITKTVHWLSKNGQI
jgi:dihydroflavonol-4-reductase